MIWKPTATIETLRYRAKKIQEIRNYFTQKGYLEVETPILTPFGNTDPYIDSLETLCNGRTYCLNTSPEYDMKRLLAAGSGPIFQFARVFRNNEQGRWHEPEFTLLEWYQLGVTHHGLMEEMDDFLQSQFQWPALIKMTYQDAFERYVDIEPHTASLEGLKNALKTHSLEATLSQEEEDKDQYLFLLMSHIIEPALAKLESPVAVYDFPVTQAALSRIIEGKAARFEIYYKGLELANGFYELQDNQEQKARFQAESAIRQAKGLPACAIDTRFLAALPHFPECSGVALGMDRVFAIACGATSIQEVIAFSTLFE